MCSPAEIIIFVFLSFGFTFFDEVLNFRNRSLTNQKQELVVQNGMRTVPRLDSSSTDTSPRTIPRLTLPRLTLPRTDNSPTGQFPDWTLPRRTLPRLDISPLRYFPERTFPRPDISLTTCFSEIFFFSNHFLFVCTRIF